MVNIFIGYNGVRPLRVEFQNYFITNGDLPNVSLIGNDDKEYVETIFEFLGLFGMRHHSATLPPFLPFLLHPTIRTNINNLCFVCSTLFIEKFNNRVARTRTLMRNRLLRFDSPSLCEFNCHENKKKKKITEMRLSKI